MADEIWTPGEDGDGGSGAVAIAGAKIRHRCDFCPAVFYDTGNPAADDQRFLRHHEQCWKKRGEDAIGAEIELRRNEPLAQTDEEQVDFLRRQAEERQDPTVKGTSAWARRGRRRRRRRR